MDRYASKFGGRSGLKDRYCIKAKEVSVIDGKLVGEPIDRLAEYENLEEQGLLLRLPCKVGDTVYWLDAQNHINSGSIICLYIEDGLEGVRAELPYCTINFNTDTVYRTREEAEKALADMKGEDDD